MYPRQAHHLLKACRLLLFVPMHHEAFCRRKSMKLPAVQFLLSLCFLMAAVFCSGPASAYDQKTPKAQVSVVGEYYRGDGLGQNDGLNLKRDKTFFFSQSSDDGQSAEWSGTYTFQNNHVTLTPSSEFFSLRTTNFRTFSMCRNHAKALLTHFETKPSFPLKTLVAVSWGKRLYLIPDEDLRHFCNDINLGEEPRGDIHGDYFVRLGNYTAHEIGRSNREACIAHTLEHVLVSHTSSGSYHRRCAYRQERQRPKWRSGRRDHRPYHSRRQSAGP